MCSPFSSCAGSFKNYDNIDELPNPIKLASKKSSKIRSWKSFSFSSSTISSTSRSRSGSDRLNIDNKSTKKNSFANQGLEKFSSLLAELEARKQKIYTQKGSQDISMVYFTYSCTDELQPLILKVKKQQPQPQPKPSSKPITKINVKPIKEIKEAVLVKKSPVQEVVFSSRSVADKRKVSQRYIPIAAKKIWSLMLVNLEADQRQIFSFFPVTIIFILVLLLFGGRSFAVLCLTVAWYLVPAMLSRETAARPPKANVRKSISRSSTFK